MPYAGLIRVDVKALSDVSLKVVPGWIFPKNTVSRHSAPEMRAGCTQMYMLQSYAVSAHRQQKVSASSAFIFNKGAVQEPLYDEVIKEMSFVLNLKKGEQISFALVGSVCSARDFSDRIMKLNGR